MSAREIKRHFLSFHVDYLNKKPPSPAGTRKSGSEKFRVGILETYYNSSAYFVKKERKKMKKGIAVVLAIALTASLVGCSSGKDTTTSSSATTASVESEAQVKTDVESKAESEASEETLGDVGVTILGARLGKDYDGNPVAYVKFHMTNKSDDAVSFCEELVVEAYQNGVELDMAIPDDDPEYDPKNYMKKIKKGASLDVEYPISLSDTKSSLEVNVEPFLSLDDEVITKTFDISKLK
jgi:hypothetical protein